MLIDYTLGQTGIVLRVKIRSLATGAGLTGLTNASAGLTIGTIADVEATTTAYTQAGSTIDGVPTLGIFQAPAAGHCRFAQVDATNHPGIYELQIANARFNVNGAKSLLVSVSNAPGMADVDATIPLRGWNPYDSIRGGMTAIPNVAQGATGSLPTADAAGRVVVGTNNDKTGYNVTGSVIVGGYSTGQDPASLVLVTPANKIATNASGKAAATLAASDVSGNLAVNAVQWAGVAVGGMPTSGSVTVGAYGAGMDPGTYLTNQGYTSARSSKLDSLDATVSSRLASSAYVPAPNISAIASAILASPNNLIVTDSSGRVTVGSNGDKTGYAISGNVTVGSYATGQDPGSLVLATPGNRIFTDSAGKVAASSVPSVNVSGYAQGQDPGSYLSGQGYTEARASGLDFLDVAVSSRLGGASYTAAPSVASIAAAVLASPASKITTDSTGAVLVSMGQPVPLSNNAQTLGDALNAARAQGFGQWLLDPNSKTLKLYGPDGTTVVRMFTLDSVTIPTART